jgi:hypothetical protein
MGWDSRLSEGVSELTICISLPPPTPHPATSPPFLTGYSVTRSAASSSCLQDFLFMMDGNNFKLRAKTKPSPFGGFYLASRGFLPSISLLLTLMVAMLQTHSPWLCTHAFTHLSRLTEDTASHKKLQSKGWTWRANHVSLHRLVSVNSDRELGGTWL